MLVRCLYASRAAAGTSSAILDDILVQSRRVGRQMNGSRMRNASSQRQKDICIGGISSRISRAIRKLPDQNSGGSTATQ